jgi:alkylresorcinol/alkylpyrone synthase
MPKIVSVGTALPNNKVNQENTVHFVRNLFSSSYQNLDRLLKVFQNGGIQTRYFAKELEWYSKDHSFGERNDLFIYEAVELGKKAIYSCLENNSVLIHEIDALFLITSSGLSTPSLDARILNEVPFRTDIKRIPIWGLGCAGGASGLSRAFEFCLAYSSAKVLVLAVELCSLTFQKGDCSKSNLIGTSLFADGAACTLITGDDFEISLGKKRTQLNIMATHSAIMPDSLDVMGWDIKNEGLYVVFSKDIPSIVKNWMRPQVEAFLLANQLALEDLSHFIAHPGGKKVLEAFEEALGFTSIMTSIARDVLTSHGNMSSVTILFVLERFLQKEVNKGEWGLAAALGPGFSAEILLVRWE